MALLERQRQSVHGLSLYCLCACALILPIQQSVAFNSRSRRARQSVATSRVHGGAWNAGTSFRLAPFVWARRATAAQYDLHYFYGTVKARVADEAHYSEHFGTIVEGFMGAGERVANVPDVGSDVEKKVKVTPWGREKKKNPIRLNPDDL